MYNIAEPVIRLIQLILGFFSIGLTVRWPVSVPTDAEQRISKIAEYYKLETLKLGEQDGFMFTELRNTGSEHSIGFRVRDFASAVCDTIELSKEKRNLVGLEVRGILGKAAIVLMAFALILLLAALTGLLQEILDALVNAKPSERFWALALPSSALVVLGATAFFSIRPADIRRPFDKAFAGTPKAHGTNSVDDTRLGKETTQITQAPSTGWSASTASATISSQVNLIRDDRDQLWVRANNAYRLACFFLFLSLGGPTITVWFLIRSRDWHYLLASISLAAVPLAIGLALLRHDNRIRDQHRDAETELFVLDRLKLAIEYAQVETEEVQRDTRRKVIAQLLQPTIPDAKHRKRRAKTKTTSDSDANDVSTVLSKATELAAKSIEIAESTTKKSM